MGVRVVRGSRLPFTISIPAAKEKGLGRGRGKRYRGRGRPSLVNNPFGEGAKEKGKGPPSGSIISTRGGERGGGAELWGGGGGREGWTPMRPLAPNHLFQFLLHQTRTTKKGKGDRLKNGVKETVFWPNFILKEKK